MQDHRRLERVALAASILALAAVLVGPAGAKPTPATNSWSLDAQESPTVVPYLSHGLGVDESRFTGSESTGREPGIVVPYLSHGLGVDENRFTGSESTGREPGIVVPYLSHGLGVDESRFTGAESTGREPGIVVPYLSHGLGVDDGRFAGTVSVSERPAGGDAWYDWSVAGIAGGAAFAALLLAAAGTLTYRSRHERTAST